MTNIIMDRRKFIAGSVLGLGGLVASRSPLFAGQGIRQRDKVRIGVIGTGSRGKGLINSINRVLGLEVVACCDLIPKNLAAALELTGQKAKAYQDYRKLLEDRNVDAVIIATPLYLRYPMAIDTLALDKHVYVEKSMAFSIAESLDLVKRVRSSKLVFQIGFQYRNYELYHKVKEVVQQGWLGQVTSFECQYNRNSDWKYLVDDPKLEKIINWRMYRDMCDEPLSELCAHQIDAVNYITDSHPIKAIGMGSVDFWKDGRETYDHVRTIYEYENCVKACYTSLLSNAYNGYQIRILGSKATIEIERSKAFIYAETTKRVKGIVDGVTGATILNATQGEKTEISYMEPGKKVMEPTVSALKNFYDCIRNDGTPLSNVETGNVAAIAICMGLGASEKGEIEYWKPEYSI
jgi:predicted dehydrogenase